MTGINARAAKIGAFFTPAQAKIDCTFPVMIKVIPRVHLSLKDPQD
jgi:hypothetical protein